MTGYADPNYAHSWAEFGAPRALPRSAGWILERTIPGFPYRDAMGCYPLFACQDWSQLPADLEAIRDDLVSLALVADPFGAYDEALLRQCFDIVFPFKEHFVFDCSLPMNTNVSRTHRKHARRALRNVQVERCEEAPQFLEEWIALYNHLAQKHGITGMRAFSDFAFAQQLAIPGMIMFRALHGGRTVGIALWLIQGDVGYGHLAAYSNVGYELGASYALDWVALEYLADKLRWIDLGGGAGLGSDGADGLSIYKRGWCAGTRTAFFCGRVLNREVYAEIVNAKGISAQGYFPAYRKGEFS